MEESLIIPAVREMFGNQVNVIGQFKPNNNASYGNTYNFLEHISSSLLIVVNAIVFIFRSTISQYFSGETLAKVPLGHLSEVTLNRGSRSPASSTS